LSRQARLENPFDPGALGIPSGFGGCGGFTRIIQEKRIRKNPLHPPDPLSNTPGTSTNLIFQASLSQSSAVAKTPLIS
jgi:hypothetical protein